MVDVRSSRNNFQQNMDLSKVRECVEDSYKILYRAIRELNKKTRCGKCLYYKAIGCDSGGCSRQYMKGSMKRSHLFVYSFLSGRECQYFTSKRLFDGLR